MKKVLILVLSSDFYPYDRLMQTSLSTWDSVNVEGTETVFYCSKSEKKDTDKIIYLPVNGDLYSIGRKTIMAFEWALQNKEFDFIARPNANCYVNKKGLMEYIETLPTENLFTTLEVNTSPRWGWMGGQAVFSRDVIQKVVDNKEMMNHNDMEDVALSRLIDKLGIPYYPATACSIDRLQNSWRCTCYGTESFEFNDFSEINKAKGQFMFRCKQDSDRTQDIYVMEQLFKHIA